MVYCAYVKKNVFYKSEFEKVSEWDTTIQDTMEEYDNVERFEVIRSGKGGQVNDKKNSHCTLCN